MDLYIGSKNYSSWSMRPWLVLEHFQIPYTEYLIPFDDFKPDQNFNQQMRKISPTGKVPTLLHDGLVVWDSLAICEYLAEQYPQLSLWPEDFKLRAQARSICAEMHSGFSTLRTLCGMNVEADLAEIGRKLWSEHSQLHQDLQRIEKIWNSRPEPTGYLCGSQFTIADAYFAPVIMRINTFKLPISNSSTQYIQTMLELPAMKKWIEAAKNEQSFVSIVEPYRSARD